MVDTSTPSTGSQVNLLTSLHEAYAVEAVDGWVTTAAVARAAGLSSLLVEEVLRRLRDDARTIDSRNDLNGGLLWRPAGTGQHFVFDVIALIPDSGLRLESQQLAKAAAHVADLEMEAGQEATYVMLSPQPNGALHVIASFSETPGYRDEHNDDRTRGWAVKAKPAPVPPDGY